jgi:hypothetical protein
MKLALTALHALALLLSLSANRTPELPDRSLSTEPVNKPATGMINLNLPRVRARLLRVQASGKSEAMTDEEDLPLDVRDAREMMVLDDIPTMLPYGTERTITRPLTEPELVEQLWRLACAEAIIQEHGEPRERRRPRDPPPRDDGCSQ